MTLMREDLRGVSADDEVRTIRDLIARNGYLNRKELGFLSHAAMMQAEKKWVREEGIEFVDVRAALDGRRDQIISWVHLSHEANRIVAEALAARILARTCPAVDLENQVDTATVLSPPANPLSR